MIERTLPLLAGHGIREVVFVGGELPPADWRKKLGELTGGLKLHAEVIPEAGYTVAHPSTLEKPLRHFFSRLFRRFQNVGVWCHNPSLGKNLALVKTVDESAEAAGVPVVFHHHDFWFDSRWKNLPASVVADCGGVEGVLEIFFPARNGLRHAAINRPAADLLRRMVPGRVEFFPNAFSPGSTDGGAMDSRVSVRRWIRSKAGVSQEVPLWFLPVRFLRRKNLLEAVLLRNLYSPQAALLVAGGRGSAGERRYHDVCMCAGNQFEGPLIDGVVGETRGAPSFSEICSAVDLLLHPSIEEGFGLTFLEAAAGRTPLLCRELPDLFEDFARWGLQFPMAYREVGVPASCIDAVRELGRQEEIFRRWCKTLPPGAMEAGMALSGWNALSEAKACVPFSRLTLAGQIEVLHTLPRGIATLRRRFHSPAAGPPPELLLDRYVARLLRCFEETEGGTRGTDGLTKWEVVKPRAFAESRLFPLLMEDHS